MMKPEFVKAVAKKSGLKEKDAQKAVDAFIAVVSDALVDGEKVQLIGFGSFETREKPARICRNPRTGEEIAIPAHGVAVFKPGQKLKDSVR